MSKNAKPQTTLKAREQVPRSLRNSSKVSTWRRASSSSAAPSRCATARPGFQEGGVGFRVWGLDTIWKEGLCFFLLEGGGRLDTIWKCRAYVSSYVIVLEYVECMAYMFLYRSMYVHVNIGICTLHMYVYAHMWICIQTHPYSHIHAYVSTYIRTYIRTHT